MRFLIHLIAESDAGQRVQEIARLERNELRLETIGLSLREAKQLLAAIQTKVVEQQVADYLDTQRPCPRCGRSRGLNGSHEVTFQTLFGNLELCSPRWNHCGCQPSPAKTFSPLSELLPEHVSPERLYLEAKWASLISFELAAHLLKDALPVAETVNAAGVRNHLHRVAERAEAALGEERGSFIEGCPREWAALPPPAPPLTVGIDGAYVRDWEDKKTHFEVIVGKSMSEEGPSRCFGFVPTYDPKPKRRLFELLKGQGMQMNQQVMFLSDGGSDVRGVQQYLNPEAEHYLDWFHLTMQLTVMGQYAKGLEATPDKRDEAVKLLESVKHYLWHGNVTRARDKLEALHTFLDQEGIVGQNVPKLSKALDEFDAYNEFDAYIVANQPLIPNYGERWRNEEAIATGFVESAVNQIVSKRFVKKQQMQWTKEGAHLLLQVRTQVLDERLEATFRGWYPDFHPAENETRKAA
jgi:hypothetical protein